MADERMYFIQNIDSLKVQGAKSHVYEFEVIADAEIVGEVDYWPYHFRIWELPSNKRKGEERKLCLRTTQATPSMDKEPWKSATKSGFYHEKYIAGELVALASLFLRRRLKRGPVVRLDDEPLLSPGDKGRIDKPLVEGKSKLADLGEWLKLVEGLKTNYHLKFILAVSLYHLAVLIIEQHPTMAYLNLVSAIEVLSREEDIGKVSLSCYDKTLAELVSLVEREDLGKKIEQAILKKHRFIKRRFVAFVMNHIEKDFWSAERGPVRGQIKPDKLPGFLKKIYDQRSRTLHDGKPFPPAAISPPLQGEEIDTRGMIAGQRKWTPQQSIPNIHFFERLTNHVLKTFLKKHQAHKEDISKPGCKGR